MVTSHNFLLIGEDEISKDRKIETIKKSLFKDRTEEFNLSVFYSKELTLARLKEAINRLPCFSAKRLIIIKDILHLSPALKTYLVSYLKSPYKHVIVILESSSISGKDTFMTSIMPLVQVFRFKTQRQANVFDLGKMIIQGKITIALKTLSRLLDEEKEPVRILGGLFWQWQKERQQLSLSQQKRQLKIFLDTDMDIKSGRLKPGLALELLVINLCRPAS